uniref:Uncharacterized protein n=1 Tax=Solanum lycopersicum TaxID=4081 RepID=A0A3Q7IEP5_SOLLC
MLSNNKKHQSSPPRMSHGLCASAGQYGRQETTDNTNCALGKWCRSIASGIAQESFVMGRLYRSWLVHIA